MSKKKPKYEGSEKCTNGFLENGDICDCVLDSIETAEWGTYKKAST